MLSRKKSYLYQQRFLFAVHDFCERGGLLPMSGPLWVAVSGGVDSMVLLYTLKAMQNMFHYHFDLKAIYIHHNTRPGQDEEMKLVKNFADQNHIEFYVEKLEGLHNISNFEMMARSLRYEAIEKMANGSVICLAHHLDDSFEWSLMQSLRSSVLSSSLGIPVKNGQKVRPFMCVSKKQIIKMAKYANIPWIDDPTNEWDKYDRNYLRQHVLPHFQKRYPNYLAHYVQKHNELAGILDMSVFSKQHNSDYHHYQGHDWSHFVGEIFVRDHFKLETHITSEVRRLSNQSRGTLTLQVKKMLRLNPSEKFGPLILSGDVLAYFSINSILLVKNAAPVIKNNVNIQYREYTREEFKEFCHQQLTNIKSSTYLPLMAISKDFKGINTSKSIHPKHKELILKFKENNISYHFALGLLKQWAKPAHQHKKLKLALYV